MYWIYILKCEDDIYYIGQTMRLYRRFWEHKNGKSVNTTYYNPSDIICIYKASVLGEFIEYNYNVMNNIYNIYFNRYINKENDDDSYDFNFIENQITECLMLHNEKNWRNIRGGKYIRFDVDYKLPINKYIQNIPLCNCMLPCDVKKNNNENYWYFRCAKKNMWPDLIDQFDIQECEPCNYFSKYMKGIDYENYWYIKKNEINNLVKKSNWLTQLVGGQYEFCIGGCGKKYDSETTIRYNNRSINLCFDCFINKNDELSNKYKFDYKKLCINYDLPNINT